jgi:hypothetical protein
MSNEIDQIIEDVEEKDLIESEVEVSEETEVTEQQEQPLSDTVLDVLLGEAKKKNEAEEDESEEDEVEEAKEEEDDDDELEEAKKVSEDEEDSEEEDEEEVSEAADEEEEDEEEVSEAAEEESEDDEEEVKEDAEGEEESDEEEVEEDEDSEEEEEPEELPEVQTKAGYLAASFDKLKGMKKSELVNAYTSLNPVSEEGEEGEVEESPKTKADLINAMYGQLKAMKKDDLMASYNSIMASYGDMDEETEADHFASDLKVLAEADQELTEDFKSKVSILFEGAVANKVTEIKESLEAQYSEDLQEEVTYVRESLVTKIDDYLSYVVESWIEENQEFVDNKLRTDITENFMKALQSTFTEHYIEVPESKVDLVDELSEQVTEIKESLANTEAEKAELASQVETLQREKVIAEASSDLASTQAGKLSSLVEETEFVDVETFTAKVATIKEGFFKESTEEEVLSESVDSANEVKTIVEGDVDPMSKLPADMAKYVQQLSKFK